MAIHYHVSENTPGYLPEAELVPTFATEAEAVTFANIEAQAYVNEIVDADATPSLAGEGTGYVVVYRDDRMHDLGRAFGVDVCVEAHPEADDA